MMEECKPLAILWIGSVAALLMLLAFLHLKQDCYFYLCRKQGSLEYCFGIKTADCKILEEKCKHESYLSQWNLNCTWEEKDCICYLKGDEFVLD